MGQSNISILNKVGYSMFWNSMWDSKNSYSRNFKEDVFLRTFFNLAFSDSLSVNTISFKNKNKNLYKKYTKISDVKNTDLYKYYINLNKINSHSSKIWILRYQKWLLIYNFIFIIKFSKNKVNSFKYDSNSIFKSNFFYLYSNYIKTEKINKYKYFKNFKNKKNSINNF